MTHEGLSVFIQSLGCDKNLVDVEHMLPLLVREGFSITDDETAADIIIVNTCCFIHDALEESINTVIELSSLKEDGKLRALIVTGCMGQRFTDEIKESLPEADAIIGTASFDRIVEAIDQVLSGENVVLKDSFDRTADISSGRIRSGLLPYSYLKIAEGCDKYCSYCVIPYVRGPYRSVPMDILVDEAKGLVREGVGELILIAEETTLYGTDIYGKKALPELLSRLSAIEGISSLRIMYAYPEEITDELLFSMRDNEKVLHYLDIPIQHANDCILSAMKRKTDKKSLYERIGRIREILPDIALRTTVITGFPGETEVEHQELLSFIRDERFDHLGAFQYSREEGTPAFSMPDQVDEETKQRRLSEIMTLQALISEEKNKALTGMIFDAVIDGYLPEECCAVGRIYRDAPEIDGRLFIDTDRDYISGSHVSVRITGADSYDYKGEIVYEPSE